MISVERPLLLVVATALFAATVVVLGGAAVPSFGPGDVTAPQSPEAASTTPTTATPTERFHRRGPLTDEKGRIIVERQYETVPDRIERKRKRHERAHELRKPTGFINTDEFNISDLIGEKVILVEFWTFGCNVCQSTHPHMKRYWRTYRDDGLVVIGIHFPEFDYERDPENVREYVEESNTTYPVVLDNEGGSWRAYEARAWPHRFLIDIDGFVRYEHVGNRGQRKTEAKIEELLAERRRVLNES